MRKTKHRKVKPEPPWYLWWGGEDYCWHCKNHNGCGSCKGAKEIMKSLPHKKQKGRHMNCKGKFDRWGDMYDE